MSTEKSLGDILLEVNEFCNKSFPLYPIFKLQNYNFEGKNVKSFSFFEKRTAQKTDRIQDIMKLHVLGKWYFCYFVIKLEILNSNADYFKNILILYF